jgi:hypothetical protein
VRVGVRRVFTRPGVGYLLITTKATGARDIEWFRRFFGFDPGRRLTLRARRGWRMILRPRD